MDYGCLHSGSSSTFRALRVACSVAADYLGSNLWRLQSWIGQLANEMRGEHVVCSPDALQIDFVETMKMDVPRG